MSSELYDEFARINRIDKAIFESEQELLDGAEAVDAKKYSMIWRKSNKNIDDYKTHSHHAFFLYNQTCLEKSPPATTS